MDQQLPPDSKIGAGSWIILENKFFRNQMKDSTQVPKGHQKRKELWKGTPRTKNRCIFKFSVFVVGFVVLLFCWFCWESRWVNTKMVVGK